MEKIYNKDSIYELLRGYGGARAKTVDIYTGLHIRIEQAEFILDNKEYSFKGSKAEVFSNLINDIRYLEYSEEAEIVHIITDNFKILIGF